MKIMAVLLKDNISMTQRRQDSRCQLQVDQEKQVKATDRDCGHRADLWEMILNLARILEKKTWVQTKIDQDKHKEAIKS